MLSKKVIAANVTNLTDARYFAARGVDYLMISVPEVSLDHLLEIKEWISGPDILLMIEERFLPLLDEAIIRVTPYGIGTRSSEVLAQLSHLQGHVLIFSADNDQIHLDGTSFVSIKTTQELEKLSSDAGIIVSGSHEDEIGLKNYEDLDLIFDDLEELI